MLLHMQVAGLHVPIIEPVPTLTTRMLWDELSAPAMHARLKININTMQVEGTTSYMPK